MSRSGQAISKEIREIKATFDVDSTISMSSEKHIKCYLGKKKFDQFSVLSEERIETC